MTEMSMQGCIRETELLNAVAYIMLTPFIPPLRHVSPPQ